MSKLIVANWKMNGSVKQVEADLTNYAKTGVTNKSNVVLALPSIYLEQASLISAKHKAVFKLASQDVSRFDAFGAYTGEISASMLAEFLTEYVIIGHSERRTLLNESGSILLNKMENALSNNIQPVFCIGEDKVLRDNGSYLDFLSQQLELLTQVKTSFKSLIIAYEPIWAIGTGVVPTTLQIQDTMKLIHAFVQNYLPHVKITVLYGGSVSGKNADAILSLPEVGGVLVGGASLKADDFIQICDVASLYNKFF